MLNTPGRHAHALNHDCLAKYIFFMNHVAKNVTEILNIQIGNLRKNDLKNTPCLRPSAVCSWTKKSSSEICLIQERIVTAFFIRS